MCMGNFAWAGAADCLRMTTKGQIIFLCIDLEILASWVLRTDACLRMLGPPGGFSDCLLKPGHFQFCENSSKQVSMPHFVGTDM